MGIMLGRHFSDAVREALIGFGFAKIVHDAVAAHGEKVGRDVVDVFDLFAFLPKFDEDVLEKLVRDDFVFDEGENIPV